MSCDYKQHRKKTGAGPHLNPRFCDVGWDLFNELNPDARTYLLRRVMYHGTLVHVIDDPKLEVERVQTGVRIEKRILKVLKAFAEYHDMTLGDVLEGIVLHAFDGKTPFSPASLERIRDLKKFYDLDLDSSASHRLKEIRKSPRKRTADK
jgi:hypothetical protein